MAVWYTLTVGTSLWWAALNIVDSRVAMGRGGPWVYLAVWLWLVLVLVRERRPAAVRARSSRSP